MRVGNNMLINEEGRISAAGEREGDSRKKMITNSYISTKSEFPIHAESARGRSLALGNGSVKGEKCLVGVEN